MIETFQYLQSVWGKKEFWEELNWGWIKMRDDALIDEGKVDVYNLMKR